MGAVVLPSRLRNDARRTGLDVEEREHRGLVARWLALGKEDATPVRRPLDGRIRFPTADRANCASRDVYELEGPLLLIAVPSLHGDRVYAARQARKVVRRRERRRAGGS